MGDFISLKHSYVILTVMGDFIKYSTINKTITLVMQNHSTQQIKQINWTTRNHLMGLQNHLMAQTETRNHFVRPQMNHLIAQICELNEEQARNHLYFVGPHMNHLIAQMK